MSKKINLRNVRASWLNSRCLVLISKYAKELHAYDETVLDLRDEDILQQITRHARETDNAHLRSIYHDLKTEIKRCLSDPDLAKEVSEVTIPDFMITAAQDLGIPKSEIVKRWLKRS